MLAFAPASIRRFAGLLLGGLVATSAWGQTPDPAATSAKGLMVFQTDFGVKDGAVSEMKGVACGVDPNLKLYDLTHEIPAFNIWEASYRLWQTAPYWPTGTVFVSVVDPGVGTNRKSVVAHTKTGQYVVTPDNGTLTMVAEKMGIDAMREIDETKNRRAGSEASYTFHGRDVYAYTGARLAAGVISFDGVGPELDPAKIVKIPYERATLARARVDIPTEPNGVRGSIPVLDPQYGNVWTNIDHTLFEQLRSTPRQGNPAETAVGRIPADETVGRTAPKPGDRFEVTIVHLGEPYLASRAKGEPYSGPLGKQVFHGTMPYANSFGEVPVGQPLLYLNSLLQVSFALNQGNFAEANHVGSGPEWWVSVQRLTDDAK